jgi:rhodanese-related sulfurtransferase
MAYREVTVHELRAAGSGARIVDVREPAEWADGHIAGAVHVPLGTVPEALDRFDGSPTYVICRSGARSGQACAYLDDRGLAVANVDGGMLAWIASGFDVVTGA